VSKRGEAPEHAYRELKRYEVPEHAYREFERDFVPLSPPPPSPLFGWRDTKGELKRGEASLIYPFPLPLDKGKGDKGGWGYYK